MNTKTTDIIIATILILFATCTIGLLPLMSAGIVPQQTGIAAFQTAFFIIACLIVALLLLTPNGRHR